jgi:trehalose 6-phosphate synthase
MVHDYHLYTLPGSCGGAADAFLHHFIHIPWTQPTRGACCRAGSGARSSRACCHDIIGFHTRSYRWNFLQCCRDLMDLDVDFDAGRGVRGREVWVRAYPLPIDAGATRAVASSERTRSSRRSCSPRRASTRSCASTAPTCPRTSCAVLGLRPVLEQHPEFNEKVTFIAQLMPSRTDVPEYAEYLERIEALVAVVNHRHGTPDWMPIQLKLRDDLEEAMPPTSTTTSCWSTRCSTG